MPRTVDLRISVDPVDYEVGGWCRTCLLPSGVRVIAMVTIGGRASTLSVFDRCADCGGDQVDPPDRPDVDHL